jgi:uncharacterized coiled-coil protein SlyX
VAGHLQRQAGVASSLFDVLKKLFFWNYARNTWQWDALCVLILIFIFWTPKSWFTNSELRVSEGHQTPTISTLRVSAEIIENEKDTAKLQERLRALTGRLDAEVVAVRKQVGTDGRILGYEVDIR